MSVNKVILVGRLGRDPEVRYMPNGEAVANFGVATSETWKDRNGERQERTEWHNVTLYRKLAEIAGQYLKKGSQVYIEGRIQSRKYTGKDGIERTAYDIIANEMKMLGGRQDMGMGGSHADFGGDDYAPHAPMSQSAAPSAPVSSEPPVAPRREVNKPPVIVDDLEDDIPF